MVTPHPVRDAAVTPRATPTWRAPGEGSESRRTLSHGRWGGGGAGCWGGDKPVSDNGDQSGEMALVHFGCNIDTCRGVRFPKERTAWTQQRADEMQFG